MLNLSKRVVKYVAYTHDTDAYVTCRLQRLQSKMQKLITYINSSNYNFISRVIEVSTNTFGNAKTT